MRAQIPGGLRGDRTSTFQGAEGTQAEAGRPAPQLRELIAQTQTRASRPSPRGEALWIHVPCGSPSRSPDMLPDFPACRQKAPQQSRCDLCVAGVHGLRPEYLPFVENDASCMCAALLVRTEPQRWPRTLRAPLKIRRVPGLDDQRGRTVQKEKKTPNTGIRGRLNDSGGEIQSCVVYLTFKQTALG